MKFEYDRNTLNATMYRLADPAGPSWEATDPFEVEAKTKPIPEANKP